MTKSQNDPINQMLEMQNRAQESMKAFSEMQRSALEAMKSFAELQSTRGNEVLRRDATPDA